MCRRSAVRPDPPGSKSSCASTGNAGGKGSASVSRMHRSTGATLSRICPVIRVSPVRIAFSSRTATGDMPAASAILSIWPSCAKHACTTPKPRMAPQGGLFVRDAKPSTIALGHLYGPCVWVMPFRSTAAEVEEYAPPSNRKRASILTISPSAVAWCFIHTFAGWRCTWPKKLSSRPYCIFTGRPVRSANSDVCT